MDIKDVVLTIVFFFLLFSGCKGETYLVIDRFEGEYAVCESKGNMVDIDKSLLPLDASEGMVIRYIKGSWHIDEEETRKLRNCLMP